MKQFQRQMFSISTRKSTGSRDQIPSHQGNTVVAINIYRLNVESTKGKVHTSKKKHPQKTVGWNLKNMAPWNLEESRISDQPKEFRGFFFSLVSPAIGNAAPSYPVADSGAAACILPPVFLDTHLFFLKGAHPGGVWQLALWGNPEGYSRLFFSKTLPSNRHVSDNEALEDEFRIDDK